MKKFILNNLKTHSWAVLLENDTYYLHFDSGSHRGDIAELVITEDEYHQIIMRGAE